MSSYSFDPAVLPGNIEQFVGVAQVPIGVAGPLLVNGEHAQGEFYVPLATTEGTLVASYNRGMKLLHAAGGVKTTVVDDRMQRAPCFLFESAREARDFGQWLDEHFDEIKAAAEATTRSGKLLDIEQYSASRMLFTRFNYSTGDAAGQNMTGKATQAACGWILDQLTPSIQQYFLESNFATDKKSVAGQHAAHARQARGRRGDDPARGAARGHDARRAATRCSARARSRTSAASCPASTTTARTRRTASRRCSSPRARTSPTSRSPRRRSSTPSVRPNGDYYYSVTIPSLIVATYGGGTGLPTQRECLEMLGCYGAGKVNKLAEIVAATVLCGEMSLGSAIVSEDWVQAHDLLGRNRP